MEFEIFGHHGSCQDLVIAGQPNHSHEFQMWNIKIYSSIKECFCYSKILYISRYCQCSILSIKKIRTIIGTQIKVLIFGAWIQKFISRLLEVI